MFTRAIRRSAGLASALLLAAGCSTEAPPAGPPEGDAAPAPAAKEVASRPPVAEIAALAEALRQALAAYGADARIETDGTTLVLSRSLREFMVYERAGDGAWSRDLVRVTGPEHDGLMMTVSLHPGRYEGTEKPEESLRESRPKNYILGRAVRGPYYTSYPSKTTLDRVDKHLLCTFVVGRDSDVRMIRALHLAMLDECVRREWLTDSIQWLPEP